MFLVQEWRGQVRDGLLLENVNMIMITIHDDLSVGSMMVVV